MVEISKQIYDKIEKTLGKFGGPFGAAILDPEGSPIVIEINRVLELNDPTAHAEITAIREACRILNTYDLSGYSLYTTCYPCPMCLSAASWANLDTIYYDGTSADAEIIGFKDADMYDYLNGIHLDNFPKLYHNPGQRILCKKVFEKYRRNGGVIY